MKMEKIIHGGLTSLNRELKKEEWSNARFTILVDENSFKHCLPLLVSKVEALQKAEFVEVPCGEECKTLDVASGVWSALLESGVDRRGVIVNLGGGCVCDLGGFVAAGYKRGIRHINIPTTLLCMVDASVGGKTAINHEGIKNTVGFFYPAALTVVDYEMLSSLPKDAWRDGTVEMLKTALVSEPELFLSILRSESVSTEEIRRVVEIKKRIVRADPFDHGIRRILNFGHTFGHAIEAFHAERGDAVSHGMAVAVGMKAALYLSVKKLGLLEGVLNDYCVWIVQNYVLPSYTVKDAERLLQFMQQDKKNADGELRCVLLQEVGAAVIDMPISDMEAVDAFLSISRDVKRG